MDNVTHSLVGAVLAETGLKRWTPLATVTLILGANFPDIDIVVGLKNQLTYLEYHRGITHAIIAIPFLSLFLAGLMYAISHWRRRKNPALAAARFRPLFVLSLISMSTHPLLDFTNSYGWRPFLPWSNQWYYGDIDFVVDPWLWAGLGGAMILVTACTHKRITAWVCLLGVLSLPVLLFDGAGWALKMSWFLLVGVVFGLRLYWQEEYVVAEKFMRGVIVLLLLYFSALFLVQQLAMKQAGKNAVHIIQSGEQITSIDAMPTPANPLRWKTVISTNTAFYFSDLFLLADDPPAVRRYTRQSGEATIINAALRESELQTFLRFARFPVITVQRSVAQSTQVEIRDARFFDPATPVNSSFRVSILLDAQLRRIVDK